MTKKTTWILVPLLAAFGCTDGQVTDPAAGDGPLAPAAPALAAATSTHTFSGPFPPNPAVEYVPVAAPCLELGEPLHMSGTWAGWYRVTVTPQGRVHVTEQIDWSAVDLTLGDLTWVPGPGAYEPIVQNVPATRDDLGEAAYVVRHQFNIRYVSQNGLPDLRVTHHVKQLLSPDLELIHNEFGPFSAVCIDGG